MNKGIIAFYPLSHSLQCFLVMFDWTRRYLRRYYECSLWGEGKLLDLARRGTTLTSYFDLGVSQATDFSVAVD